MLHGDTTDAGCSPNVDYMKSKRRSSPGFSDSKHTQKQSKARSSLSCKRKLQFMLAEADGMENDILLITNFIPFFTKVVLSLHSNLQ